MRLCSMLILLAAARLAGCGSSEPGRLGGGTAGGAATGAAIGLIGGPIGVVLGGAIGAGVGAITATTTSPKQVNIGLPSSGGQPAPAPYAGQPMAPPQPLTQSYHPTPAYTPPSNGIQSEPLKPVN